MFFTFLYKMLYTKKMNEANEIIQKINQKKGDNSNHPPLFEAGLLDNVHERVVDKLLRRNKEQPERNKRSQHMSNPAEQVIAADKEVREAVQNLVIALSELGDKTIALKLISQHIMFLNDMFTEFEK